MCIMRTYETRGRGVTDPPPRRGNFTSHPPAGVMRLPREWRRSESYSDDGRVVEYRHSQPRVIEYYEEPRRSTTRARSVSRRRISDIEVRNPRGSYVDERVTRRSVSRVRH
ncbi:hypothetical protein J1614_010495 [Plenodomus biglobosus]|nr:hypothetical protein J1614_010495 [Plenodomus biglobosus]